MKNILLTGGAGFIGSNLAIKLIGKGYRIRILDNLSRQIHGDQPEITSSSYQLVKDNTDFILGSVTSRSDWMKAIKDQDIVIHFAAETGTGQSMYEIGRYVDVNCMGTALLLDILANEKHNIKKVVIASSRAVYGEGKYRHPQFGIVYPSERRVADMQKGDFNVKYKDNELLELLATDEDSKIHPSSVYAITKQHQEQMIMTVCPTLGIAPVAFRYQNVYGPGQSLSNPYTGILSIFSNQILNGNEIKIFEDGKESRDFVFIDDVVNMTLAGIENSNADGHVFNVGTGVPISVLRVAQTLVNNYNKEVPINITKNFRLGDIRHNYADMMKIKKLLDCEPQVSFERGIEKFTKWVSAQEVREDKLNSSLEEMRRKGLYKL